MGSHIQDSPQALREFWAGFPHDQHGNVVLKDPTPDELGSATADPKIQAIIDRFSMREG